MAPRSPTELPPGSVWAQPGTFPVSLTPRLARSPFPEITGVAGSLNSGMLGLRGAGGVHPTCPNSPRPGTALLHHTRDTGASGGQEPMGTGGASYVADPMGGRDPRKLPGSTERSRKAFEMLVTRRTLTRLCSLSVQHSHRSRVHWPHRPLCCWVCPSGGLVRRQGLSQNRARTGAVTCLDGMLGATAGQAPAPP